MLIFYQVLSRGFKGVAVARLPFEPLPLLRYFTHRGLPEDSDPSDVSVVRLCHGVSRFTSPVSPGCATLDGSSSCVFLDLWAMGEFIPGDNADQRELPQPLVAARQSHQYLCPQKLYNCSHRLGSEGMARSVISEAPSPALRTWVVI